jgi:hypothetical protein
MIDKQVGGGLIMQPSIASAGNIVTTAGAFVGTNVSAGVILGATTGGSGTPYVRFHPSGHVGHDVEMLSTGGTGATDGTLEINCAFLFVPQLTATSLGLWGANPPGAKPVVSGAKGGNAALASLLTALAAYGLVTDNSTA